MDACAVGPDPAVREQPRAATRGSAVRAGLALLGTPDLLCTCCVAAGSVHS